MATLRYYHFKAQFYQDAALSVLVNEFSSEDSPELFRVNGGPMPTGGYPLSDFSCVEISFELPLSAPATLFNRTLYVKIVPIIATASLGAVAADVLFVIDESGSMNTAQAWIASMVTSLESHLAAANIGPNRYGCVGFGRLADSGNPRQILFGGQQWVDAATFSANLMSLIEDTGGTEDGYKAIDFALDNYTFRGFAVPALVLVTNEDRDVTDVSITKESLLNRLSTASCGARRGTLTSILQANFQSGDGSVALGVRSDGLAVVQNGSSYTFEPGGVFTTGYGTTYNDYVDLTWEQNGSVWSISQMLASGDAPVAFTDSFVDTKVEDITAALVNLTPSSAEFFCARSDNSGGTVSVPFTPEADNCYHYRISFYADRARQNLVYSAFSMSDQRRWFADTGNGLRQIPPWGVRIDAGGEATIYYKTAVLPHELTESQTRYELEGGIGEIPLVCGVKYYVDLEVYDGVSLTLFDRFQYRLACDVINPQFWATDDDKPRWVSSGQGADDLRVTKTSAPCLKPSIDANYSDQFIVAWQDFRDSDYAHKYLAYTPKIYFGVYDATHDRIWASGQGLADAELLNDGFTPIVTADYAENFHVTSATRDTVLAYRCRFTPEPSSSSSSSLDCLIHTHQFFAFNESFRDSEFYLRARVYKPDVAGTYVSSGDPVAIVEDCVVRFEISGAPGAYAVRAKNESGDWSQWIPIDAALPSAYAEAQHTRLEAYYIDHDRFVTPWVLSAGTGIKNIEFQVLTFFGVSPPFGVGVVSNVQELEYRVDFYYDEALTQSVPTYHGTPVLTNKDGQNGVQTVYIRVEFTDKEQFDLHSGRISSLGLSASYTFNVIQQGSNDQMALPLTPVSDLRGVFKGSFTIAESDGVLNKDGLGAIIVNIPNPCTLATSTVCGNEDMTGDQFADLDPYNRMDLGKLRDNSISYESIANDLTPQSIQEASAGSVAVETNLDNWKTLYSADDPRFSFGNPRYFIRAALDE